MIQQRFMSTIQFTCRVPGDDPQTQTQTILMPKRYGRRWNESEKNKTMLQIRCSDILSCTHTHGKTSFLHKHTVHWCCSGFTKFAVLIMMTRLFHNEIRILQSSSKCLTTDIIRNCWFEFNYPPPRSQHLPPLKYFFSDAIRHIPPPYRIPPHHMQRTLLGSQYGPFFYAINNS